MRVQWVISQDVPDDLLDFAIIKEVAPSWGSWSTWKQYKTDNCICTDTAEAKKLIKRAFHAVCNFYIMQESYSKIGSPLGVKLFNGKFKNPTVSNKDDLVALNLASIDNDIVLLSGFNFSPITTETDEITKVAREEYYYNLRHLMTSNASVQYVLVDYTHELASWAREMENLTTDTIASVKSLLV